MIMPFQYFNLHFHHNKMHWKFNAYVLHVCFTLRSLWVWDLGTEWPESSVHDFEKVEAIGSNREKKEIFFRAPPSRFAIASARSNR